MDKNKPIKEYKAANVTLSVWENEKEEGEIFRLISFQRSYKDSNEDWHNTKTLRISDLPKLNLLISKAYSDYILTQN